MTKYHAPYYEIKNAGNVEQRKEAKKVNFSRVLTWTTILLSRAMKKQKDKADGLMMKFHYSAVYVEIDTVVRGTKVLKPEPDVEPEN